MKSRPQTSDLGHKNCLLCRSLLGNIHTPFSYSLIVLALHRFFFCWSLLEVSFVFCVGLFCLIFAHLSLIDLSFVFASSFFPHVFVHPRTHVHIYTHTHTHIRTHTYKHTRTHTHTHTSGMACVTGYRTWFYYVVRGVKRDLNLTMTVNNMNPQVPLCVCVTCVCVT